MNDYATICRNNKEAPYRCETCEKSFESELDMLAHHTTIDDITCQHLDEPQAVRKRKREDSSDEESSDNSDDQKLRRSNPPGSLECFYCHKVFKKKKYLKVHMSVHGSPHVCHICGSKKTTIENLNIHIRRHNKDYSEFCKICKKGFYAAANLKNHMSKHTNEKPFECKICKRHFGNSVYLKSHMRIHSHPESRKKFGCAICGFETFYHYCYKQHLWTHTGEGQLPCEHCGKLIRKEYMKIHNRIHTGEKPEICEFCGRTFGSRKYLIKHRRIHTGERPYVCTICHKAFTQRGTLTSHLRIHNRPS